MFGTRSRSGVTLRALAGSLVALLAVPSAGFAQDTKAGVVTTLEGNVTARRIALPSPVPLKVKDGVFFQDTVSTGDKALVRILLGGKAVVTIRELSVLTITEVPGQSTIDLESGKFGLAVAREKMRPGEAIRIRTPNAIAAVHGTVVVTEVSRKGAQLGGSAPAVTTKLYVLTGNIMAQQIDATTKQPIGTGVSVGALQAYSGAGGAPPQVTPIPPEQVSQVTSGLHPTGPKGGSDAGQEQVKAQAVETALALAGALTGTTMAAIVAPTLPTLLGPAQTPTTAPLVPPIDEALESQANKAADSEIKQPINVPSVAAKLPDVDVELPDVEVKLPAAKLSIPAGTSLKTFTGTTVLTTTDPVLTLTGISVTQLGTDDLISVAPGASLIMAGPMANVIDSVISTGGAFLGIDAASVTSSALLPFISFDLATVSAGSSFVQVEQGSLNLAGSLLQATNSTITSLVDTISVTNSTLTNTTTSPLIVLSGSTLNTDVVVAPSTPSNQILNIFAAGASPAAMSLAGPVLSASASTVNSNEIVQVLNLAKGAALTSTTSQPLVQLDGTTLTTLKARAVNTGFSVFSAAACPSGVCVGLNADGTFATMNLTGPLLSASNGSSVNTSASIVFVGPGGQISVTGSTDPLISLAGGTHAIASNLLVAFAPAMFDLRGRSTATGIETADGVSLALGTDQPIKHGGGLLEASGATITSQRAFRLDTALLAASAPLVNLKPGSKLTSSVEPLDLVQKAKLTSLGPIVKLDASNLIVNAGALALVRNGSLLRVTGDFLQLNNASTLALLNGPLLSVSGNSVVNISGALVNFGGTGSNLVSVTNTLCSPSCTSIGGLNVNLVGGASAANVTVSNPIKNGSLGSLSLSNGAQTAVISISGANSKVTISGN